VCSTHYNKDIKLIEGIERRATRLVSGMKSLCSADRLKNLGLTSLENRRIRSDLIETYKIINNYYNIDASLFFQFDEGERRGHSKKLYKRRNRLDTRKYVFANLELTARCIRKQHYVKSNQVSHI